jgi:phytanoyl-CoA hydroxylase
MSDQTAVSSSFLQEELDAFQRDGFLIAPGLVPPAYCERILEVARQDSAAHRGDIEYEAELQYPGAPSSLAAEGGRTIRRLRQAFCRDYVFADLLKEPFLLNRIRQLVGPQVVMPLAHHNCIMTKHPRFSSDTGWHQDIRYWSFSTQELVNAWIALGTESLANGCLQLLPGTHRAAVEESRLDSELFLREDLPQNSDWLNSAVSAELNAGDVLFFHARSFHSATRNSSDATKYSAVFTFRSLHNPPLPDTRSSSRPELLLT